MRNYTRCHAYDSELWRIMTSCIIFIEFDNSWQEKMKKRKPSLARWTVLRMWSTTFISGSKMAGAPAVLAILIAGFSVAARAQGTANSQPEANPTNPQAQPGQPTQPTEPVLAQPAAPVSAPAAQNQQQPAPANDDLVAKSKSAGKYFQDQAKENRSSFELRQLGERKDFEQTIKSMSFWERRRLTKEFNAEQSKKKKAFNDEQEKKRRMYEWRFP